MATAAQLVGVQPEAMKALVNRLEASPASEQGAALEQLVKVIDRALALLQTSPS
jgi:hypothetical protein